MSITNFIKKYNWTLLWALVPFAILVLIIVIAAINAKNYIYQCRTSKWASATASAQMVIDITDAVPDIYSKRRGYTLWLEGGEEGQPIIEYNYSVSGIAYTSSKIMYVDILNLKRNEVVSLLHEIKIIDNSVTVYYDEQNPGNSVLIRGSHRLSVRPFINMFPSLFVGLILSLLLTAAMLFVKYR